jgi:hypothetical protein
MCCSNAELLYCIREIAQIKIPRHGAGFSLLPA